ncbi:NAD(P)H-binding protein [Sphingomonas panacisoli]|nr:NAD(P)H-binding protein [Sphingomonas panacisoli]
MKTALVLGASGGVGGETARALIAHSWSVRGLTRTPRQGEGIDWIVGDAMDRDAVLAAAKGVDAIVHAVNPPGYRDWEKLVMPMLANSIAAAQANDARLALPGTIYNFDPATSPVIAPDNPQRPMTNKGAIRVEMERAIEASGVKAVILRAGDFFGPRPGNSWLSQGMVTPGKPVGRVMVPGRKGVGHAWAYLPDVGEAFARLLDKGDDLPRFVRYHFAGDWDADGTSFAASIGHALDRTVKTWRMPWAVLPLIGLFNPTMREMVEMRPFWENPVRLDNRSLVEAIGVEPHTPLDEAMRTTLAALGCH